MLLIFLGDFLMLPVGFLMLPGDDAVVVEVDTVVVDDVQPDDGCCPSSLTERDGNVSSGAPALSRQSGGFWRSVDCKVEDDDAGGHTHGDMSLLVPVPPNSSLPELLHGDEDVAVGGLGAPVPGLAVGSG